MSALLRSQKVIHGFMNSQQSMQRKCYLCNRNQMFHFIVFIIVSSSFFSIKLLIGKLQEVVQYGVTLLPINESVCVCVFLRNEHLMCPVKFARCQQNVSFDNNLFVYDFQTFLSFYFSLKLSRVAGR